MDVGSTITEDLFSEEGLKELVQHALENLQGELELLHLSLLRKHDSVKHETSMYNILYKEYPYLTVVSLLLLLFVPSASSKQRSNIRRSIAADKSKVSLLVKKYNGVLELLPDEDEPLLVEDILAGKFPWSVLHGTYYYCARERDQNCLQCPLAGRRQCGSTRLQLESVIKFNLISRYREEEALLLKEMKSYIDFYQNCLSELDHSIEGIGSSLACCMYICLKNGYPHQPQL